MLRKPGLVSPTLFPFCLFFAKNLERKQEHTELLPFSANGFEKKLLFPNENRIVRSEIPLCQLRYPPAFAINNNHLLQPDKTSKSSASLFFEKKIYKFKKYIIQKKEDQGSIMSNPLPPKDELR